MNLKSILVCTVSKCNMCPFNSFSLDFSLLLKRFKDTGKFYTFASFFVHQNLETKQKNGLKVKESMHFYLAKIRSFGNTT